MSVLEVLATALNRTVPISDPKYIIGEDQSLTKYNTLVKSVVSGTQGFIGSVILGQVGNGKTHFLRYVRKMHSDQVGVYVPDMFVSGPLAGALNSIYHSLFYGPDNASLRSYYDAWQEFIQGRANEISELSNNEIVRYLLQCNNREEAELILDYFSNKELFPDQLKFLKSKYGAKKSFINNENDFAIMIGYAFQFIQTITGKAILLFVDEVDKVYSFETKNVCLSRVSAKILTAYRILFDHLNGRNIYGIISIGATPEAWDVLSQQSAFERRFKDREIRLKSPKSSEECFSFAIRRLDEIGYKASAEDKVELNSLVNSLKPEDVKTWADVISKLRANPTNLHNEISNKDPEPADEILGILNNSIFPLTWSEIVSKSALLQRHYPKSQPTPILKALEKSGKIITHPTKPQTYETKSSGEDTL